MWLILALIVKLLASVQPTLVLWLGVVLLVGIGGLTIYSLTPYCLPDADDPKFFEKDDFWEWTPKIGLWFGIPTALVVIAVGLSLG